MRQNGLSWVSTGDSRVYLWSSGGLIQLSRDHDFAHELALMKYTWDEIETNPRQEALAYHGMWTTSRSRFGSCGGTRSSQ